MSGAFVDLFGSAQPRDAREARELLDSLCPECPAPAPNPRLVQPNNASGLAPNPRPESSLAESLGSVVDSMRQLYTDFGMRPYRVWSVVYRWTGGEKNRGDMELVSELEFLPTPFVDMRPLRSELKPAGEVTRGNVQIRDISPRYTEDQIQGAILNRALGPLEVSFVEIRVDARDGQSVRRRISIADVPWRDPNQFGWSVSGFIQEEARRLDGSAPDASLYP